MTLLLYLQLGYKDGIENPPMSMQQFSWMTGMSIAFLFMLPILIMRYNHLGRLKQKQMSLFDESTIYERKKRSLGEENIAKREGYLPSLSFICIDVPLPFLHCTYFSFLLDWLGESRDSRCFCQSIWPGYQRISGLSAQCGRF